MAKNKTSQKTMLGEIDSDTLAFTAGDDIQTDLCLLDADCAGTAAHVTMLSEMQLRKKLFSATDKDKLIEELARIMLSAQKGDFKIKLEDQDVHMAVERTLTARLGTMAKAVHTARSRNDQIAVDLRLYAKEQISELIINACILSNELLKFARKNNNMPMVGRTHMRPAMPSSVGLWASAYSESLIDDISLLKTAYEINDQCPLGSAAGYGVPMPINRQRVSDLLGFSRPIQNVFHASNARGKTESIILSALSQVMLTLSRLAQDLMIFTMPEFGYFILPPAMGTGSSIMPQKNNPDILELIRAKASKVISYAALTADIVKGLPGGYNRDLQETKEPFLSGLKITGASLKILAPLIEGIKINKNALSSGFTPAVFATDRALALVADGTPFRDAYLQVKERLHETKAMDPFDALKLRNKSGNSAKCDFTMLAKQIMVERKHATTKLTQYHNKISKLLKIKYPVNVMIPGLDAKT